MGVLFFVGIAIIFGFVVGKIVNRLRLPSVVGYLLAGLVLGPSILKLFGAIGLGGLIGIIFGYFIRKLHVKDEVLAISLGAVLICTGLSKYLHVSLILSNLSLPLMAA